MPLSCFSLFIRTLLRPSILKAKFINFELSYTFSMPAPLCFPPFTPEQSTRSKVSESLNKPLLQYSTQYSLAWCVVRGYHHIIHNSSIACRRSMSRMTSTAVIRVGSSPVQVARRRCLALGVLKNSFASFESSSLSKFSTPRGTLGATGTSLSASCLTSTAWSAPSTTFTIKEMFDSCADLETAWFLPSSTIACGRFVCFWLEEFTERRARPALWAFRLLALVFSFVLWTEDFLAWAAPCLVSFLLWAVDPGFTWTLRSGWSAACCCDDTKLTDFPIGGRTLYARGK